MNKIAIFFVILLSQCAHGWECPQYSEESKCMGKIDCLWKHKKRVFIGSLQMGEVSEDQSETNYMYTIKVAQYLKGSGGSSLNYEADWSSPLTFGEQYIFFTDGDQKLDLCDFYKGFSFDWLAREDIPEHKKFVEEVVKITGQSGLP